MDKKTSGVYAFGDFRIDVSERQLSRDRMPVPLPPKVFDVLLVLVENFGRIVGKEELMTKVWSDTFVEDANLTVNISALRKVLSEDSSGTQFIETVPKRGYRFIAPVVEMRDEITPPIARNHIQPETDVRVVPAAHHQPASSGNVVALAEWHRQETQIPDSGAADASTKAHVDAEISDPGYSVLTPGKPPNVLTPNQQHKRIALLTAASLALIAVALFGWSRWSHSRQHTNADVASPITSIAVLPFDNAIQDSNAEYLSDGITESLINRLSQLSGLKIASRSSVFRYKGTEQDIGKVGQELNVRAVLTGSVKQIDDQLVITVRLDDTLTNQHIWGEQYVRKFADILNVQKEIAQDVTDNLRLKLTGADEQKLAKNYTQNTEAYQLYLKGVYEWNKHTQEDLFKAIDYYNQALEKDANFALAYMGLANCYGVLGNNYLAPNEAFPKAKSFAAKALEIDETLPGAHASMAAIKLFYEWDWAEAAKEIGRAKELDPDNASAYDVNGAYLEVMGRLDEAEAENRRGQELEPLSLMFSTDVGIDLYYARRYDEAIDQLNKTINLDPRYNMAYLWLGQAFEQKKMFAEAIATYQKGISQGERHPKLLASLGRAYALSGDKDKATRLLNELREMSKRSYISPYFFAIVYDGLGDREQTFSSLDKALQDRSVMLIWLSLEPRFDSLRDDPRFKELLGRIGLKV